jgi:hypothetical protein
LEQMRYRQGAENDFLGFSAAAPAGIVHCRSKTGDKPTMSLAGFCDPATVGSERYEPPKYGSCEHKHEGQKLTASARECFGGQVTKKRSRFSSRVINLSDDNGLATAAAHRRSALWDTTANPMRITSRRGRRLLAGWPNGQTNTTKKPKNDLPSPTWKPSGCSHRPETSMLLAARSRLEIRLAQQPRPSPWSRTPQGNGEVLSSNRDVGQGLVQEEQEIRPSLLSLAVSTSG